MTYQFFICDVFTKHAFQGNQLAVIPEASGLNDEQMQQIAREFNFSETTFVFPPEQGQTKRVRIFTPTSEVTFAGPPQSGYRLHALSQRISWGCPASAEGRL